MARKPRPPSPQLGLSLPATPLVAAPPATSSVSPADLDRTTSEDRARRDTFAGESLDDFDDYDDHSGDAPRLRLVDPPSPVPRVVVEALDDGRYEVSRLRDNGTTVASVTWTRDELAELIERARAALEMGR